MKNKEPEVITTFAASFLGEWVRIVTKIKITETMETEEGILENTAQLILRGYLVDYDDSFYYLGEIPNEVNQAVERRNAPIIQIEEQINVYEEILNNIDIPEDKGKIN